MSAPGWRTWWSSPRAISKKDSRSGRSSGRSTTVGRGHHLAVGRVSNYLVELSSQRAEVRLVLPEHHAQRSLAAVFGLDLNPRPTQVALIDRTVRRFTLIRLPRC